MAGYSAPFPKNTRTHAQESVYSHLPFDFQESFLLLFEQAGHPGMDRWPRRPLAGRHNGHNDKARHECPENQYYPRWLAGGSYREWRVRSE